MTIVRLPYFIRRLVMPIDRHTFSQFFAKICQSPSPLNGHTLTHISDRALLLYQVRLPIEMLYLGRSNPLQGQVGERPQQHVEPLLVLLRGPEHRLRPPRPAHWPTTISSWVTMSIYSYLGSLYQVGLLNIFLDDFTFKLSFLKKILNDR